MTGLQNTIHQRQQKLRTIIQDAGLAAVVINPGPSLFYFTGLHFHLSERPVILILPVSNDPAIVLPQLETGKLKDAAFGHECFQYGEDPAHWAKAFTQAVKKANLQKARIGVEPRWLRVLELNLLKVAAPGAEFVPTDEYIARLRMFKDEMEIDAMRQAVQIAQEALKATQPIIKNAVSEIEIANELTMQLFKNGSNPRLPFFPIVSAGPNSANPHAAPSDRKLRQGDLLVIDYGANVRGYFSDITRTFAIGEINSEFQKIADVVLAANQAGRKAARPGVPIGDVDRAARKVIEEAGYGRYFTHRTGHGLGLEGHEEPYVRADNRNILETGMSFTVEPGIYLPDRGGVRIEDNVIITHDGCESLTDLPRDLICLP